MEEKTILKKTKTLFGVIIIGAIGSGLWDLFLKSLIFDISNLFVKTATLIYSGYVDYLYDSVGTNGEGILLIPALVLILMIINLPLFLYFRMESFFRRREFNNKNEIKESYFSVFINKLILNKRRTYFFVFIITIPISIMYTNLLIKHISTLNARKSIERNIEIIRPNISEIEYLLIRSKYRQIDNKEKLINTIERINKIASDNKIELPQVDYLGIDIN